MKKSESIFLESQAACQLKSRDSRNRMNPLHIAALGQDEKVIGMLTQSPGVMRLTNQRDSRTRRPAQLLDIDSTLRMRELLHSKMSRAQLGTMTTRASELDTLRRGVKYELAPLKKVV